MCTFKGQNQLMHSYCLKGLATCILQSIDWSCHTCLKAMACAHVNKTQLFEIKLLTIYSKYNKTINIAHTVS